MLHNSINIKPKDTTKIDNPIHIEQNPIKFGRKEKLYGIVIYLIGYIVIFGVAAALVYTFKHFMGGS